MIRILTAAAISLAATMAFADSHNTAVKEEIAVHLEQEGIDYDVEMITDEQAASIKNILDGGDDANAKKSAIMAILGLN